MGHLLGDCKIALDKNNFNCCIANNLAEARELLISRLIPGIQPSSISYGDSETLRNIGVLDLCKNMQGVSFVDPFDNGVSFREQIYRRKEALNVDLFMTGTNAITMDGMLVNLDMIGNRIGGITFGPRKVIIVAGKNKIVSDLNRAFARIKEISAPKNAARHPELNLPCQKTGKCMDCSSPYRICNTWAITEKSYPKGRITVVLINENVGY